MSPNRMRCLCSALIGTLALWTSVSLSAREARLVISPASSVAQAGDAGAWVRTHVKLLVPQGGIEKFNARIQRLTRPAGMPPATGYGYQTPASLACLYGLVPTAAKCNPNVVTTVAGGGSRAIAIVDAFHYPYAKNDLARFAAQFGLPTADLTVVYASGRKPFNSPDNWEVEAALDLQGAHAMAPRAKLYLVEAASNSVTDLLVAVKVATRLVQSAGGGEVSMSWGSDEFASETKYEASFNQANVVYIASSGDAAGTSWPCVSPNVVCVGGTTVRSSGAGDFLQEVAWDDGGSGFSLYFSAPAYQKAANGDSVTGSTRRGVPDVALAADPATPGWIFYTPSNTAMGGWYSVGGTSWAAPSFAGIVNAAGSATGATFAISSAAELIRLYSNLGSANFTDIVAGWCGIYAGASAASAWDGCTGIGSSKGLAGK